MEKTMYVVTSGDYSDYRINAIFDSEDLAQKFIDVFKGKYNEYRIEDYKLNPYKAELNKRYKPFFIRMNVKGITKEIYITDRSYGFNDGDIRVGFDINKNMYLNCFAKDKKHAIKIANEQRTKLIALNKWKY